MLKLGEYADDGLNLDIPRHLPLTAAPPDLL
jgi:hypothetical protein